VRAAVRRKRERVVEMDIDQLPKNAANYTALTPLWFLERAATVHPTRNSLIHGSRRYTWQQTYHRCRRFASALSNNSIGPGNIVLSLFLRSNIFSPNFLTFQYLNSHSSSSHQHLSLYFSLIKYDNFFLKFYFNILKN